MIWIKIDPFTMLNICYKGFWQKALKSNFSHLRCTSASSGPNEYYNNKTNSNKQKKLKLKEHRKIVLLKL